MYKLLNRLFSSSSKVQNVISGNQDVLKESLFFRFFNYLKNDNLIVGPNLINNFKKIRSMSPKKNLVQYNKMLNIIDKESSNNLHTAKQSITGLIDALIEISPGEAINLKAFDQAMCIFEEQFKKNPTRENFIKFCFYLGMLKKRDPGPEKLSKLIKNYFNKFIDDFTSVEFAIFCTATFKASVKLPNNKFKERLVKEILSMKAIDSYILVCFIKSLRQNQLNPPEIIEKLKSLHSEGKFELCDVALTTHILPYIADNKIIEPDLTRMFIQRFFATIDETFRVKDIQKFTYSCALLNFQLKKKYCQQIEDILISKVDGTDEYSKYFDAFVDTTLSLWMLNHRSKQMIFRLFTDDRFFQKGAKNRIKIDSRKLLLKTCVEIEEPSWLKGIDVIKDSFNPHRSSPSYLIRKSLEKAQNEIKGDMKIVQQFKNLNIAGIISQLNDDEIHYEVLDNSNCLNDDKSPDGFFALKLRLLKQMNCKIKMVRTEIHFSK